MVKGVNKTVIEVNNTGSRYFEKIVFYVTPQYGNLSAKQLKRAASTFSFNFDNAMTRKPLRKKYHHKKIIIFSLISLGVAIATVGLIILL
ncbi:MAG: hypothetical protein E7537_04590 [Ruminococcaceae bacterium]|nr:hypothetical protein [Oscillospiraceae bacterium]